MKIKSELNTYYATIQLSIFHTAILIVVANSRKEILEDFPKIYKRFKIPKEDYIEDIKAIEGVWNNDDDPDYMPPGETLRLPNDSGDVIIFFKENCIANISEELIVHETHHASSFVCQFRGIKDEECEAYVQDYVFNQMMCKIDDWNNKFKKRKR
jgi:hypothetical protein